MTEPQSLSFERNEETGNYHLILDGEDKGPVKEQDLQEASQNLLKHFKMFTDRLLEETQPENHEMQDPPGLEEAKKGTDSDKGPLTDEDVKRELEQIKSQVNDDEEE